MRCVGVQSGEESPPPPSSATAALLTSPLSSGGGVQGRPQHRRDVGESRALLRARDAAAAARERRAGAGGDARHQPDPARAHVRALHVQGARAHDLRHAGH
eukprot:6185603-Pleurochrysis_carterae.AAC.4